MTDWAYLFRNVLRLKEIPKEERLELIVWKLSSLAFIEFGHCAHSSRQRVGAGTTLWSTGTGLAE